MASWKTTLLGVCTIITAIGAAGKAVLDGDPSTTFDMATTAAAVMSGVGLIFARDNNVSSEEAGAK